MNHKKKLLATFWLLLVLYSISNITYERMIHNRYLENFQPTRHSSGGAKKRKLQPPTSARIWPVKDDTEDRIQAQMIHVPEQGTVTEEELVILVPTGQSPALSWTSDQLRQCPVSSCRITDNVHERKTAHAVLVVNRAMGMPRGRSPDQIWILYMLESPEQRGIHPSPVTYNWTATYRRDSTLPTPYGKFVPYMPSDSHQQLQTPRPNYATGKTRMVAWFVSNCKTRNGRVAYAHALRQYVSVDIYGACGVLDCPAHEADRCNSLLRTTYKFYLAFENSNCRDYISEKFFTNALGNDVVPIVMGARPKDYAAVAPPHSYIHVDDFESPRHLADYLQKLDANDSLYNGYFHWKERGELINTRFWCRLCSLMHEARSSRRQVPRTWYPDLGAWWGGEGVCVRPAPGERWATWRGRKEGNLTVRDGSRGDFVGSKLNISENDSE